MEALNSSRHAANQVRDKDREREGERREERERERGRGERKREKEGKREREREEESGEKFPRTFLEVKYPRQIRFPFRRFFFFFEFFFPVVQLWRLENGFVASAFDDIVLDVKGADRHPGKEASQGRDIAS